MTVKLVEELIEKPEVQKYQEILEQRKIRDMKERRKIERKFMKEEFGNNYVSSDDDSDNEGESSSFGDKQLEEDEDEEELKEQLDEVAIDFGTDRFGT